MTRPTNVNHNLPRTAPVVIVGGGIVGIATAFFLKLQGITSIVLEAEPGIGQRTTAMSAHCIRAQFSEPDNIAMMAESVAFYENIAGRCDVPASEGGIDLCQQGYLFASTDPADRVPFAERLARQVAAGLDDVELLDGNEVKHRYPWLSDRIAVATYRPGDGWIDSHKAIAIMARASGASLFTGVDVEEIQVANGRVTGVVTRSGTISTDTVVLAAGPFSGSLSPEPLPLSLLRRHRVIVDAHPDIPQDAPVTIDANTGAHWRPHRGGALAAWALPEEPGEAVWPVPADPAFVDRVLRGSDGIGRLAPFWRQVATAISGDQVLLTAGQYTMTPDHRPLIGPAPQTGGLYLHTGYSGHGIMGAPAGARLLAGIVSARSATGGPFSPDRFLGQSAPPDIERVVI